MEIVAVLPGFKMGPERTYDLRWSRTGGRDGWRLEITGMTTVATSLEQAREFALACRACLTAGPGVYEAAVFADGLDEGWMDFEVTADGKISLDLGMNLSGAVGIDCVDYDRELLGRFADAILGADG